MNPFDDEVTEIEREEEILKPVTLPPPSSDSHPDEDFEDEATPLEKPKPDNKKSAASLISKTKTKIQEFFDPKTSWNSKN